MVNLRPVGYVIGLLVCALGGAMLVPLGVDIFTQNGTHSTFGIAALITCLGGGLLILACSEARSGSLSIQQTFLLTTGTWLTLPFFGALPFWLGADGADFTDAFFEAMSGLTTTGSTVFTDLDGRTKGFLLWRAMMQWFGGIGVIVFAVAFLPALKVGGMQLFKSEAFDTQGKILPRAAEIATSIATIYGGVTLACVVAYDWAGMSFFDAVAHALTTVATGGFSTYDASIGHFGPEVEYIASLFMIAASLPFIRYVQLMSGQSRPLLTDSQIRDFLIVVVTMVAVLTLWLSVTHELGLETAFRQSLFNGVSILSGTGYASVDYQLWGPFAVMFFFLIGLIGGCAGSTTCSIKVFRFQLLFSSLATQIRRLHSPNGVFTPRYDGKTVADDVINSVMAFFVLFVLSLLVAAVALGMIGLDAVTSISGAATALANVGPGLGPIIGPAGTFADLPDAAKWVLSFTMLVGRLELMSVFVLFTPIFWTR